MAKKKESLTLDEGLDKALVADWEQPYQVPNNWLWIRLGELLTEVKNGTTIKQDKALEGFNVTRIESLQQQTIDFNRLGVIVDDSKIKDSDWYKKGDIALSHINSAEHVGKTAFITEDMLPLVHGMNLLRLRFNNLFDPKLFQLFSQSFQYKQSVIERINMAVNQVSINQKQLCTIEVPLPPLDEQQRIVGRIQSLFFKLDEAKEKAQVALDSFEKRKTTILHMAFTGELTKKWRKDNNIDLDSWEKTKLGKACQVNPKRVDIKKMDDTTIVTFVPMPSVSEILGEITEPISERLQKVKKGYTNFCTDDVLFAKITPCMENGKSAVVGNLENNLGFGSTEFHVLRSNENTFNRYIYHLVRWKKFRDEAKTVMTGAVGQQRVPKSFMEEYSLYLPSLPEQTEIVRILDSIFENEQQAKELTCVIEKIDLIKKAILARAFRGELGTNNPEEESALQHLKEMLSKENIEEQKPNKKQITIPNSISKQFKTDLEEQIYRVILENQNSTLNQILSCISSSKHLDAMEVITILYEKGLINKKEDLYSAK
ncbi:type I restriction enzyme S subunit [Kineothrix alysoides]|uniref:Type I restriction enzyme S subunit n=1 Tax=Kineothrix alysoides TaxID=1469948 RepID=A0A4R1R3S4_9FIRM|nr:restriction endonuclease subunit S [Kineothrix alysoides]TCL60038.1 type I restriction enzyme S subunit [Kineothrix alysoides]